MYKLVKEVTDYPAVTITATATATAYWLTMGGKVCSTINALPNPSARHKTKEQARAMMVHCVEQKRLLYILKSS